MYALLMLYPSCNRLGNDDYVSINKERIGAIHVYFNPSDTASSLKESSKIDTNIQLGMYSDSVYLKHKNLNSISDSLKVVFVDDYKGLFIYPKKNGIRGYYLKLLGAYQLESIDIKLLKVKSAIGIAIVDFSLIESAQTIRYDFDYNGYGPPISFNLTRKIVSKYDISPLNSSNLVRYFFDCPTSQNQIIIGWDIGMLSSPKCYGYTNR